MLEPEDGANQLESPELCSSWEYNKNQKKEAHLPPRRAAVITASTIRYKVALFAENNWC